MANKGIINIWQHLHINNTTNKIEKNRIYQDSKYAQMRRIFKLLKKLHKKKAT